jgi:dihydrofolate reductase
MGRIVVSEFISLDGVMEDPGGAEGYRHGGWTFEFDRGSEGDKFKSDEAMNCYGLLLGRITYEGFAKAWPAMQGEFADRFNTMPKYVVSKTLQSADWTNSTIINGELATEVAALKDELDGDLVVHGSASVAQELLAHDLVDVLHLMVFPVLLGAGKRLFTETAADKQRFTVSESRIVGDGVAINIYERARA